MPLAESSIGNFKLYIGDGLSPEGFDVWCEVFNIPEFGETNDLIEVTAFCNDGNRQYASGLADGIEVEFQGNHIPNSEVERRMIQLVRDKSTVNLRIDDENISPPEEYDIAATALSWRIGPVVDDRNTFVFGIKINTITVPT